MLYKLVSVWKAASVLLLCFNTDCKQVQGTPIIIEPQISIMTWILSKLNDHEIGHAQQQFIIQSIETLQATPGQ